MNYFRAGSADPQAPALYDGARGLWLSYGQLAAPVDAAAAALAADRKLLAFCLCGNDVETIVAYLAALEAGHAVALLDATADREALGGLFERYRPELVLAGEGAAGIGELVSGEAWSAASHAGAGVRVWRRAPQDPPPHADLAVMLTTSGSTGSPKLVRLSRRNVESNADSIRQALDISPAECAITSLPLFYSYGLSVLNSHLAAGARLVVTAAGVVSREFWTLFEEQGCTSFAGVPYTYQILDRLGLAKLVPDRPITLTQAGGKLDDRLIERFHGAASSLGGRMYVMYGQTEATARISVLPADRLPEKPGSVGPPIPGGSLEIVGSPGAAGEVVYRGPNVMMGYAEAREDLELADSLGGTLHTGDVGRLDSEGFLYILGRTKRFAKVYGLRLNLDDIELRLRARGPTAVIEGQEQLLIFCEHGDADSLAETRRELAGSLRLHPSALVLRRVEALPLTSSGKPDYERLRELA